MKEFTFAMITYNQEKYVLEHLESIKFQILNFGKNYKISFILGDDASKDKTVEVIKQWLNCNNELFENIEILPADKNVGIVKNVIRTLQCIKTNEYKLLAGDDLYFKNNIFELYGIKEFILTPLLMFSGLSNKVIQRDRGAIVKYKIYLLNDKKNKLFDYIKKYQKYVNTIEAPAVFMKHSLIDNKFYDVLSEYKWIEDVPMWNYLFYMRGANMSVSFYEKPLVLYRCDVGISTNKEHDRRSLFEEDLIKIEEKIYKKDFCGKRVSKLMHSLEKRKVKFLYDSDKEIKNFEEAIRENEDEVNDYLKYIDGKVKEYKMMLHN